MMKYWIQYNTDTLSILKDSGIKGYNMLIIIKALSRLCWGRLTVSNMLCTANSRSLCHDFPSDVVSLVWLKQHLFEALLVSSYHLLGYRNSMKPVLFSSKHLKQELSFGNCRHGKICQASPTRVLFGECCHDKLEWPLNFYLVCYWQLWVCLTVQIDVNQASDFCFICPSLLE